MDLYQVTNIYMSTRPSLITLSLRIECAFTVASTDPVNCVARNNNIDNNAENYILAFAVIVTAFWTSE